MSSSSFEMEYVENIDALSEKLKDPFIQAYINLNGVFQGVTRYTGDELINIFHELSKPKQTCYYYRLSFRKNGKWDELGVIVCGDTIIACHGSIDDEESTGLKALQKIVENINSMKYTHGIVEAIEIAPRFIEERLGVEVGKLFKEEKPVEEAVTQPTPSLVTEVKHEEVKPVEEKAEEKAETSEVVATIPLESSMTRTETLPERIVESKEVQPEIAEKPIEEVVPKPEAPIEQPIYKPLVIEEALSFDKVIIDFSENLSKIISGENIGLTDAVIRGDQDRIEVETTVTKLGWSKRREKMIKIAEEIANALTSILQKNNAPQREVIVTVKHGYNAVKISKKISF